MLVQDLFLIMIPVLIALIWWHDRGIKQKAFLYAQKKCQQYDVQILDEHVRLAKLRLIRNSQGHLVVERTFSFEFITNGEHRYQGEMIMQGKKLFQFETEAHHIH